MRSRSDSASAYALGGHRGPIYPPKGPVKKTKNFQGKAVTAWIRGEGQPLLQIDA